VNEIYKDIYEEDMEFEIVCPYCNYKIETNIEITKLMALNPIQIPHCLAERPSLTIWKERFPKKIMII